MRFRRQHGVPLSLALAAHPLQALLTTLGLTVAAALSGRAPREWALVAATVLAGQVTVGWVNDVADRHRDRQVGRQDRPVAMEWVDPGTVTFATACVVLLLVPLSVANGTAAGVAYLLSVAAAWSSNLWFHRTRLSWLPWAVSFGLLPAFLSYGGWGGGLHGAPPTVAMTVLAALLGVGVHVLTTLPDLVEDRATGLRHLPLRVALRIGAPRLLAIATAYTLLVGGCLVAVALNVGLRQ
ncbi:UbiA family prenyltransferase [Nocardioides mesophilus]|uniref:UbiA family prenyltransferase n=1 Tax=Nocardioides mesophilus TaxID=433659 RepID=A0A7G9RE53_9ACTN|nr:UbiA family prenyltransferase [Nocardioides mesophilus]QNN53878.1 UbiA family prenyltransferase [Nocardioides mesophilus]